MPGTSSPLSHGKSRRIRTRADFLRVQSGGKRSTTAHFVFLVLVQENSTGGPARSRLGIVVSRKIGHAAARNRVKRLCRECFRLMPNLLPDGLDLVVIARHGADSLVLAQAQTEWEQAARSFLRKRPSLPAQSAQ
jgi:ribonuclease P protein component